MEPRQIRKEDRQLTDCTDASDFSFASSYVSEDEDFGFEEDASEPHVVREKSDKVLDAKGLAEEQQQQTLRICELLELPKTTASVLLSKYGWDSERLIDRFMEDAVKVCRSIVTAGLVA